MELDKLRNSSGIRAGIPKTRNRPPSVLVRNPKDIPSLSSRKFMASQNKVDLSASKNFMSKHKATRKGGQAKTNALNKRSGAKSAFS